ncbi:SPOR domain-containing protein [Legionella nagasakiensis]|uniref:SPOR domain-containing protein n=1 Tax=Legionella nagasakiensis TaxID=535290 RepID=UPI001056CC08|nr:SPOR domain-containing protein [Legionella nagasakiensis]
MAKEYRKKGKTDSNGWLRQMMLVFMSFFCGYLSASLFNFTQVSEWLNNSFFKQKEQKIHQKDRQQVQLPKPKLEFYTLLAKEQTAVPAVVNSTKETPTKQASASTVKAIESTSELQKHSLTTHSVDKIVAAVSNKETYLVQVASFRNKEDAERMKATLILKGFNVNVAAVTNQQVHWYRVIIGPFPSRIQAEKAQTEVARSERIMGMIRKMDA